MNYYSLLIKIKTGSPEQREQLFKEIENRPLGDMYLCRYHSCERIGECDIKYYVSMRGGITKEVSELCDLPQKHPNITEEVSLFVEGNGVAAHKIFKHDCWEEIRTIDDTINTYDYFCLDFSPSMLEIETFRKVYDYDGNLISEESEMVPFPVESMSEDIRKGYKEWKADPVKWEKEEKEKELREKQKRVEAISNNNGSDLPF